MTDRDLVEKRLAFLETCIHELRSMAEPDRLEDDVKERRFVLVSQGVPDLVGHAGRDMAPLIDPSLHF